MPIDSLCGHWHEADPFVKASSSSSIDCRIQAQDLIVAESSSAVGLRVEKVLAAAVLITQLSSLGTFH